MGECSLQSWITNRMNASSSRDNPTNPPSLISPPLDALFETLLSILCDRIAAGVVDDARSNIVHVLHHYAILNKEAAGLVRADTTYPAVIWYERVRLDWVTLPTSDADPKIGPLGFFLEGLPRGMPIFGAPVALQLPPAKCLQLSVRDVRDERKKTVDKLDGMVEGPRLAGLAEQLDCLQDVTLNVPQRVRIFVSRMRSVCKGVRESKPTDHFTQCRNVRCNRFFFCGDGSGATYPPDNRIRSAYKVGETPIEVLDLPRADPQSGENAGRDYWTTCGDVPWYKDPLQRFCSSACCIEWRRQMDRCIPDGLEFDAEVSIKRTGLSRIQKAFDAALARNAKFSAALNEKRTKRAHRKAKSIVPETLAGELDARIDLLNIDLGVLYWSTLMSGCPENIYNRALPGDRPGWRNDRLHVTAARTIALLYCETYQQYPKHRKLITDTLNLSKFFSAIKTQSARLL